MHKMIIEEKEKAGHEFWTNNIASLEEDAKVVPIRTRPIPFSFYEHSDLLRITADLVEDREDHALLQNALMDEIWDRYVGDKDLIEVSIRGSEDDDQMNDYDSSSDEDNIL